MADKKRSGSVIISGYNEGKSMEKTITYSLKVLAGLINYFPRKEGKSAPGNLNVIVQSTLDMLRFWCGESEIEMQRV